MEKVTEENLAIKRGELPTYEILANKNLGEVTSIFTASLTQLRKEENVHKKEKLQFKVKALKREIEILEGATDEGIKESKNAY